MSQVNITLRAQSEKEEIGGGEGGREGVRVFVCDTESERETEGEEKERKREGNRERRLRVRFTS